MSLPVILDGDPGLDDAVAWWLALASPELDIRALTTTHGNVALPLTTRNAGVVLTLAARADIPYFSGAALPLVREPLFAGDVHGETGLPASGLPEPQYGPEGEHAALALIRLVRAQPREITVIATGPLTNLALAFRLDPQLPALLREVVWMGGSTAQGNRTAAAEFNALADPHAAHIVFESGVRLRMVGLNVTMQAIATPERVARMRQMGRVGQVSAELLNFYAGVYARRYGLSGGALHDPLAVAAAIRPELLTWQKMGVDVEITEGLNFGRTVCDLYNSSDKPKNATVAVGVNDAAFGELLLERLARLP